MLPAPGELVRLALPCPPQLVELSGYDGGARLVAMWWSPLGDELMICDGTLTMTGCWRGWLCFCGHPLVRVFLDPYRLGDSENEGEHRLLADRHLATVHASVTVSYRELAEVIALAPGARRHIEDDPLGLLDGLERLLEDLMARFEERRAVTSRARGLL